MSQQQQPQQQQDQQQQLDDSAAQATPSSSMQSMSSMPSTPAANRSNYTTIRELGRGTFATVLLAEHNETHQQVAVKRIRNPDLSGAGNSQQGNSGVGSRSLGKSLIDDADDEAAKYERRKQMRLEELIMREVNIWWELPKHSNIVELKDAFRSANHTYLVMELMTGGSLEDLNQVARDRKKRVVESRLARWFSHVVAAVCFLHSHGVVHRDIKPANILLSQDMKTAKLADFGLARQLPDGTAGNLTKKVGSMAYMAAEAFRGKHNGFKADIWSIGVAIYESLCGVLPFNGSGRVLEQNIVACQFEVPQKVSPEARDIICTLLQKNPDDRPAAVDLLQHPWIRGVSFAEASSSSGCPTPQTGSVCGEDGGNNSSRPSSQQSKASTTARPSMLRRIAEQDTGGPPAEDVHIPIDLTTTSLSVVKKRIIAALESIDCTTVSDVNPEPLELCCMAAEVPASSNKICVVRCSVLNDHVLVRRLRGHGSVYRTICTAFQEAYEKQQQQAQEQQQDN